jgi:hypothetical protein
MTLAPSPFHNDTADRIADLLDALGDTPDGIAERLAEAGITGFRSDATCCPIANYLLCAEPLLVSVAVLGDSIDYSAATGEDGTVAVPPEVNDFVSLFDTEHFPHLITHFSEVTSR